jgi:regulator of sigma E protease
MAAMEMVEGKSEANFADLPPCSPWARIFTAFAGPFFSFLFAVLLAFVVWGVGKPDYKELQTTQVGFVLPDSPAAKAGIVPGDTLLRIDGATVTRFDGTDGIQAAVVHSTGDTIRIELRRVSGEEAALEVAPKKSEEKEGLRIIGVEPVSPAIIERVGRNSPAAKAGLKKGDRIVAVGGKKIFSLVTVEEAVRTSKGPVPLSYERDGVVRDVDLVPAVPRELAQKHERMSGIEWQPSEKEIVHPDPWTQIRQSSTAVFRVLESLVNPRSDVKLQHLSGPIGIFNIIIRLLLSDPLLVLAFAVVFNVNLAILNMLPIPILDGGHILLSLIEVVRRKPVDARILQTVQLCFFVLLIGMFLFISYHDVWRIGKQVSTPQEEVKNLTFE